MSCPTDDDPPVSAHIGSIDAPAYKQNGAQRYVRPSDLANHKLTASKQTRSFTLGDLLRRLMTLKRK